ncbi:MAG: DEAD/DEAH box helicase [Treponemataceae bacterium]
MNFTDLTLDERLQKGINAAGYEVCTPVQEKVLTSVFNGSDLYVQSHTGSGKTAAYLITIFQQILENPSLSGKKVLVMVPTRELAVQVEEEARLLGKFSGLKCASFYGGVGYEKQHQLLKKGVDILVGTPGRLIDLQKSGVLDLSTVGYLVVDEADRMFDMGFYPDLRTLINFLPKPQARQTLLFSATLSSYIKNLAWEYTADAQEITIESENIVVNEIEQILFHVSSDEKMKLLLGILQKENPASVIIFCNTKKSCEIISKRLEINGIKSEFIVGDLPQKKRLQIIASVKKGDVKCLVATDVASRGIDVNDLALVINYDLPSEAENYVHRIGRTARAGKTGKAYSFCSEQDVYNLPSIEKYTEVKIPSAIADDSMYQEDKSKGVYIKLDRDERFNEKKSRPAERSNPQNGRGRNDSWSKEAKDSRYNKDHTNRTKTDFKQKENSPTAGKTPQNPPKAESYRKDHKKSLPKTARDANLSHLSFEERMKIYKEKYDPTKNPQSKKSYRPEATKKTYHTKSPQRTEKPAGQTGKAAEKKTGFVGKLLSLFKK